MSEPTAQARPPIPHRELRDPQVLRALSHPLRLRIYDELTAIGPATATELAGRIGESPTNCSWHLRRLARHGLVEEAGGGPGRRRPWRVVAEHTSIAEPDDPEPEFASARDTLAEVVLGRELEVWREWLATRRAEPADWRAASFGTVSISIWLTADELAGLTRELRAVVERHLNPHLDRIDPGNRPPDCRPVRVVAWGIPYGPPPGGEVGGSEPVGGAASQR